MECDRPPYTRSSSMGKVFVCDETWVRGPLVPEMGPNNASNWTSNTNNPDGCARKGQYHLPLFWVSPRWRERDSGLDGFPLCWEQWPLLEPITSTGASREH